MVVEVILVMIVCSRGCCSHSSSSTYVNVLYIFIRVCSVYVVYVVISVVNSRSSMSGCRDMCTPSHDNDTDCSKR